MAIHRPKFAPTPGYREVEQNGERVLLPVENSIYHENEILKAQLQAQTDRSDFIEDCIAELAIQAYQ